MTKEPKGCPTPGACSALKELTASHAREAKLRKLLHRYRTETPPGHQPYMIAHEVDETLAIPLDDTALQEWLKQERERCATIAEETAAGRDAEAIADTIRALT